MNESEALVERQWQGKTKTDSPSATLSTTNPTWAGLGSNPNVHVRGQWFSTKAMAWPPSFFIFALEHVIMKVRGNRKFDDTDKFTVHADHIIWQNHKQFHVSSIRDSKKI
jgi:hypothetical protein